MPNVYYFYKLMFRVFVLLFALLSFSSAQAQVHEFGMWGGIANYFGDLNTQGSFVGARPGAGVFYRMNWGSRFAWRSSLNYGWLEFADNMTNIPQHRQRNLSFQTHLYDITTQVEFNFFKYDKTSKKKWWTPYLGVGFSVFFFNPRTRYQGDWVYLQPLGTEGQTDPSYSGVKKYRLFSFAIPIVGGFKFSVSPDWNIGIEAGFRKTFTDYLDDVSGQYPSYASLPGGSTGLAARLSDRSGEVNNGENSGKPGYQRGYSPQTDDYLMLGISVSYTIMKMKCPSPSRGKRWID